MANAEELRIVFLEDAYKWKYWREATTLTERPKGRINPTIRPEKLMAYAEMIPNTGKAYYRRFWYLKEYDLDMLAENNGYPFLDNMYPTEAVVPDSIFPNHTSKSYPDKRE